MYDKLYMYFLNIRKKRNTNINKTKLCSGPASHLHIFNVRTINMQSSNIQTEICLSYRVHSNYTMQSTVSDVYVTMSTFNTKNVLSNVHKI